MHSDGGSTIAFMKQKRSERYSQTDIDIPERPDMVAILTFEFAIETCLIVEFPVDAQTVIWTGTGNIAFENVVGIDDRFVVAREFMDNTAFHVRLDITVFADFPFFAQDETGTACYDIGIFGIDCQTVIHREILAFQPEIRQLELRFDEHVIGQFEMAACLDTGVPSSMWSLIF